MFLSIVIPVFNEAENIRRLYCGLKENVMYEYEIIVIDDGSFDGTFEILKEIAKKDQSFKVIKLRHNLGKTIALAAGFAMAEGEWIITMDGDLQNDPSDIKTLMEKAQEGYDVVSGWRKKRMDPFWFRRFPSIIANKIISVITNVKLHDYGCMIKAYKSEYVKNLFLYGEMHRFLPAYIVWEGAKLAEVVVKHHPRRYGKSHYGLERIFKVILDLIIAKYFFSYISKPIYIFGGAGLISLMLGVMTALFVLIRKIYFLGEWISPMIFVMFFLFGISVLCILMGFIAEILTRVYFETRYQTVYQIKDKINLE